MQYEKQKITFIKKETKTSPRTNKPYERVTIKTDRHGDKWLSGFGSLATKDWQVGTEIAINVTSSVSQDGTKTYWNFDYQKEDSLATRVAKLEINVQLLMNARDAVKTGVTTARTAVGPTSTVPYPERPNDRPMATFDAPDDSEVDEKAIEEYNSLGN